jgi:hypothetical protein
MARALLLWLPLAGAAFAQEPSPSASAADDTRDDDDVPTVVVTPDDPLVESDRKLSALIKGLPGADHPVAAKKSLGEKVGDWYDAHRSPNDLDADQQRMIQRSVNGDPERQNLP